jgi:3',5'-cyclic AMP phosphodiesterase CpdA
MELYPEIKRIIFITDTHFGIRNNSVEWIDIQEKYFFDWFIPKIKEMWRPGDCLVHLGDVYDSRQSLNLRVLNFGVSVFEALSKIFKKEGIYILCGNHDIYGKETNDVNSLVSLKWIPSVKIYQEPASMKMGNKTIFMMPWRKDHDVEGELLGKTDPHDYLFCHTDINGMKHNKYANVPHGISYKKLEKFERVYSGHIHYAQNYGKVRMLGSPYQLTRADAENQKHFLVLDLETGEETYHKNDFSPEFIKVPLRTVMEKTPPELEKMFENKFVDITIASKVSQGQLDVITQMIRSQRDIKYITEAKKGEKEVDSEEVLYNMDGKNFSILDIMEKYVLDMEESESEKEKIKKTLKSLYLKVTKNQELDEVK